ncbi:MAG: YcxB family protein [Clostridium sp.]|nr:YcxB family protein [Clostridium sp.]MCM1399149.1 YcxB family protein [Clostridium sp.]MCM1459541.1 YcxB family protein [Bacteroides sp.]
MVDTKTKTVNMTYRALCSYVLNTYYRSFAGASSLVLGVGSIVLMVIGWNNLAGTQKVILAIVAVLFLAINPLQLMFKAYQQLKLSSSYKKPLNYTFSDKGIMVSQDDVSQEIPWESICRLFMTGYMIAIYTSRLHAFVIPLSELGEEKGKIIASVVQFTAANHPRISKNLTRYQSGKGL